MQSDEEQLRFMRLWTAAQPTIVGYVRSLVRGAASAEEVVQNTALVLYRRFADYDQTRPFVAWALGIARLQVLSQFRDADRDRLAFDSELLDRFTTEWANLTRQQSDREVHLQDCIRQLAGRARQIIRLRYYEELSAEQIARQTNATGASIRVTLQRIRRQLRECVERQQHRQNVEVPS